ncbi:MAG: hypothetical protein HOY78_08040, partial [Saccharothrix sp.]|nr:hypothetical protein [Saccharothrix sp.]
MGRRWQVAAPALVAAVVVAWSAAPVAQAESVAANTDTAIGVKPMMGFNNWARFTC